MEEYYQLLNEAKKEEGFTLVELLIVVAIIAILAGVVFVALDPAQKFGEARDSTRETDVQSIAQAISVDQVDNGGDYVSSIESVSSSQNFMIGTCSDGNAGSCSDVSIESNCVDLTGLSDEGYLPEVPTDPQEGSATNTGYYLRKSTSSVFVGACTHEDDESIEVSR